MGTTTSVTKNQVRMRSGSNAILTGMDMPLVLTVFALIVLGLVILYSASMPVAFYGEEGTTPMSFVSRQAMFAGVGLVAAFIISLIDYRVLKKFVVPALFVTWIMLFLVLVVGTVRHGATRTFFNGSVQPSEIAKVVIILYLAFWLKSKREELKHITIWALPIGIVLGVSLVLLYFEPDYSAILNPGWNQRGFTLFSRS